MSKLAWIHISAQAVQGTGANGWSHPLSFSGPLPSTAELAEALPSEAYAHPKLGVVLPDSWLSPLRVQLEEGVANREIPEMLRWKLKRLVPYDAESLTVRYLPLTKPGEFLTFCLPGPWAAGLHGLFKAKGVHCGYMGGMFSTLLENMKTLQGALSICLFGDTYYAASLAGSGKMTRFSGRRMPYSEAGQLDTATLASVDLTRVLEAEGFQAAYLFNLEPALDGATAGLRQKLARFGHLNTPSLQGSALERFHYLLNWRRTP